jgi:hypothetical protein
MLIEHVIYSLAIAIIFGVLYRKHTGRELSWIIIMSAYASDLDLFMENLLNPLGITVIAHNSHQNQISFHNLSFLLLYAAAIAFLLSHRGFKFLDAFIFAGVGFGAGLSWLASFSYSAKYSNSGILICLESPIHPQLHQLWGSNSLFLKSSITAFPESTSILLKFLDRLIEPSRLAR